MSNREQSPINYAEALENCHQLSVLYDEAGVRFQEQRRQLHIQERTLEDALQNLGSLRYRYIYQLLENQGLGVCSAEIVPDEFAKEYDHNGLGGLSEAGKLGIFPIGELRFIYFRDTRRIRTLGTYDGYEYHDFEFIFQVCPYHYPQLILPQFPRSVFSRVGYNSPTANLRSHFADVGRNDNGEFHLSDNKTLITASFKQSPLPEKIFQHFEIAPLSNRLTDWEKN